MPRLSLRRSCFYLVAVATLAVVAINMRYRDQWLVLTQRYTGPHLAGVGGSVLDLGSGGGVAMFATPSRNLVDAPPAGGENEVVAAEGKESASSLGLGRQWFFKGGWLRPEPAPVDRATNRRVAKLWPHEDDSDRIVDQLMFVPPNYNAISQNGTRLKKILLYNGIGNWFPLKAGQDVFLKDKCPVDTCSITANRDEFESSDAVLFRDHFSLPKPRRPAHQAWMLYLLECPLHTQSFHFRKVFNWTATYRHDSDVVAPYERFVPYDPTLGYKMPARNYATNKTRKVAWFVSNCGARNNRLSYARHLAQHIEVDIYGACGTKSCPRSQHKKCFDMLNKDYKFYLSFENSNCKDYITEKFFVNGLGHDIVPIVMGARKEDYERAAPYHSFISVEDFESPKALAEYLYKLDANDTLYNEYFQWKGTGEFVNTHFWCRVCALLHDKAPSTYYDNIDFWWRGPGACAAGLWRDVNKKQQSHLQPVVN